MTDETPRYSLSYVISARKFCVHDSKTGKRWTGGGETLKDVEDIIMVLNAAEAKVKENADERRAL